MSNPSPKLLVTGATGQLGRLVITALLKSTPTSHLIAGVRDVAAAADLAARGVELRKVDYDKPETMDAAFQGVDRVLLISSNAVGQRVPQHSAAIAAAKKASVSLLAYTSVLRADTTPIGLAVEHLETERLLRASGIPFVLLRNGWYTENYTASVPAAVAHGAFIGSAGAGRIASAARADFADAAAAVLTSPTDQAGRMYELAGDSGYTLSEFAAEISRQTGKTIPYVNMAEADYRQALIGAGLPDFVAALLAESDVGASKGGLYDDGHQLSTLIGRPTTPWADSIAKALEARA